MTYPVKPTAVYVSEELVEAHYAALPDPALPGAWPIAMLKHLVLLSTTRRTGDRYSTLLANILKSLPLEQSEWFANTYAIPGNVTEKLDDTPLWPEHLAVEGFPESGPEDLAAYITQKDVRLVLFAETEAARVIKKGDRISMAYLQKFGEAKAWNGLSATKKASADMTFYPNIVGYASVHDMSIDDACATMLAMGMPWYQINAQIETARELFQVKAKAAAEMTEVEAAYDEACHTITGLVDMLVT